jgi:transcriptional regulator with XRE-family HTH domain
LTFLQKRNKIDKICQDIIGQDNYLRTMEQTFGDTIRAWRKQRGEPLRVVAAAIEIDSTLLSKIERGERLPTQAQLARFADYFGVALDELAAQVIADKIILEYGEHRGATLAALKIVRERIVPYQVDKTNE